MGEESGKRARSECLDEELTFACEQEDFVMMIKEIESKYGKPLFQKVMSDKKLYEICDEGRLSVLQHLFTDYPKLVLQLNKSCPGGDYLLHRTVCGNVDERKLPLLQYLIKIGADLNVKNGDGDTPLNLSVNSQACLKALLNAGADVFIQNNVGRTAIFYCAQNGFAPAAGMLLNHIRLQGMGLLKQYLLIEDADGRTVRDVAQWDVDRQEFVALLDDFLVQAGTVPPEDQHNLQQRLLQLQISRFQHPSRPLLPHHEGALLSKRHFRPGSVWAAELENFPILGFFPAPSASASVSVQTQSSAASNSNPSPVPSASTLASSESSATSTPANQKKRKKAKKKKVTVKQKVVAVQSLPHHCLAAYNTFMCLPPFSKAIMQDTSTASVLLRLARIDPDEQNGLYSEDTSLITCRAFVVLQQLLNNLPLGSEAGIDFRRLMVERGAFQFLLSCVEILTRQKTTPAVILPSLAVEFELMCPYTKVLRSYDHETQPVKYFAEGTGFGVPSRTPNKSVEEAGKQKQLQEEQLKLVFLVLAAYFSPSKKSKPPCLNALPEGLADLINSSSIVQVIHSYLKNDSVLDIESHSDLYESILTVLKAFATHPALHTLLSQRVPPSDGESICSMLFKLNRNYESSSLVLGRSSTESTDLGENISTTFAMVLSVADEAMPPSQDHSSSSVSSPVSALSSSASLEEVYHHVMTPQLFGFYDLLVESADDTTTSRFTVAYQFEKNVRDEKTSQKKNLKNLCLEVAAYPRTLPLSASSSIFVRCDTNRMDIIKVLITGPAGTPYANGCYLFDVFIPPNFPNVPLQVKLSTTGSKNVEFNPNLFSDGNICLSLLNSTAARPEERWNPNTSTLLGVLVSIQSQILVKEPYFNEFAREEQYGTPEGTRISLDYNARVREASVIWAMLDQILHPSPCFKEVILAHFWLKREEIKMECEEYIAKLEKYDESRAATFKSHYAKLERELDRLERPASLVQI